MHIRLTGENRAVAGDGAYEADGSGTITAGGSTELVVRGDVDVELHDSSQAVVYGAVSAIAKDSSHVSLRPGAGSAALYDHAHGEVWDGVTAGGRSTVTSWGADVLELDDRAVAHVMHDGARVTMRGSAVLYVHRGASVTVEEAEVGNVIIASPGAWVLGHGAKNATVIKED